MKASSARNSAAHRHQRIMLRRTSRDSINQAASAASSAWQHSSNQQISKAIISEEGWRRISVK